MGQPVPAGVDGQSDDVWAACSGTLVIGNETALTHFQPGAVLYGGAGFDGFAGHHLVRSRQNPSAPPWSRPKCAD